MKIFLFDTETVGLNPLNFVYDIGWFITDQLGNVTKRRNFLITEVITDGKKMMGAYFAKKIFSFYIPALDENKIRLTSLADVQAMMYEDLRECEIVSAYNLGFDLSAMENTLDICGAGECINFDAFKKLCLWQFAASTILNTPTYHKVARANGWRTKSGNYRTTAEHTYRFLTGQNDFIESHTALDDCVIENEILKAAYAKHKKIPYDVLAPAWRIAQPPEQLEAMKTVRRMKQLDMLDPRNYLNDRG
jgi:hypothetical protein